ncbi:ceramidase domain-containing protein [Paracoccaceae bacterium GXU_MW_L88]
MFEQFDAYCERTDFSFWSEPVNALTNLAFILAALIAWRRIGGRAAHPLSQTLCLILFIIGIGSFLFHSFATAWASLADTLPILAYVVTYIFAATFLILRQPGWRSAALTLAGLVFAVFAGRALGAILPLGSSSTYAGIPVLIALYSVILRGRDPETAKGWIIGAGILAVSIIFRTLDGPICDSFPLGTHFLWHILNAVMLCHMILVLEHGYAKVVLERGRPLASPPRQR